MKDEKLTAIRKIARRKMFFRAASRILKCFISINIRFFKILGKLIGHDDMECNLMMAFSEVSEKYSKYHIQYNLYPKKIENANNWVHYKSCNADKMCIVIQGPIRRENDFTLETVRMYGRIFPGVLVILSTWKSESLDYLKKFDGLSNCKVVLNDFPENAGYLNLNYQITSSLGGIRHAMECGKEYVLKSRTDFRITDSSSIDMLFNFVYSYSAISDKQKSRIVLFNSMLLQPYAAYDFFVFGACADLEKYYNYAWSDYKGGKVDSNVLEAAKISYRQSFELGGGENGFLIPYVRYLKETCDCDLEQWWEDLGKFFISLPLRILAPVWRKYDYNFEESNLNMTCRRELLGSHEIDRSIVEFGMWQDMYNGKFILNSKDYEGILNKPM